MPIAPDFPHPGRRRGRPRSNACESCRWAKVRCDQQDLPCARCARLNLQCSRSEYQAPPESTLRLQSRDQRIHPRSIEHEPRNIPVGSNPIRMDPADYLDLSDYIDDALFAADYLLPSPYVYQDNTAVAESCNENVEAENPTQSSPIVDHTRFAGVLTPTTWSMHEILLDDALLLSGNEYHALVHFRDRFISTQLLKTPQWSTYGCILRSILHVPMAMHFLLALSSLDLIQRSPRPSFSIEVSRSHLQRGSEMLIGLMNHNSEPCHLSTLVSWYFLYICMMRRDTLDETVIDQLSTGLLNYLKRYKLHYLSAGIASAEQLPASSSEQNIPSVVEAGLIGRILLFLLGADTSGQISGCGGQFAKYLCSDEDLFWRIFRSQRYILERFWGPLYPDEEILHDLETSAVMEMRYATIKLIQEMTEHSLTTEEALAHDSDIECRIAEVERTHSSILRLAQSHTVSMSPILRNAKVTAAWFHFMQVYYFRLTLEDSARPTPPHIISAMTNIMNAAHRSFSDGGLGHDQLAMPLFIMGIETKDQIHIECVIAWLAGSRVGIALQKVIAIQQQRSCRLHMGQVRKLLRSPLSML